MLVAGEASGDALGGRLMAALRERTQDRVRFTGIGGELMQREGLQSLFPMSELSIMGIAEVLPRLPRLLARIRETATHAATQRPDAIVTIDAPSFAFRVLRKLAGQGIPRIHYVAPQVWAWRPGRARHLDGMVDELLALLPFEPAFFEGYGVSCRFVGHPAVENPKGDATAARQFRRSHGIPEDAPVLGLLPGSRLSETRRHLPVFGDVARAMSDRIANLHVVAVTLPTVADGVIEAAQHWPAPTTFVIDREARFDAFAAMDAALAASGTVSLELALAGTPTVVAYRTSWLTAALVRRLIRVDYVAMPNILAGRAVMPEFIQDNCLAGPIADELGGMMRDESVRAKQTEALRQIALALGAEGTPPSFRAADAVLEVVRRKAEDQQGVHR